MQACSSLQLCTSKELLSILIGQHSLSNMSANNRELIVPQMTNKLAVRTDASRTGEALACTHFKDHTEAAMLLPNIFTIVLEQQRLIRPMNGSVKQKSLGGHYLNYSKNSNDLAYHLQAHVVPPGAHQVHVWVHCSDQDKQLHHGQSN